MSSASSASSSSPRSSAFIARVVTALAVLVSGLTHGWLFFYDGWRDVDVIGPLFMVNAISGVIIAGLVLGWRHWFGLFLAFGFSAVTFAALLISRWWGLFGVQDTVLGASQITSLAAEFVGMVAAVTTFVLQRRPAPAGSRAAVPGIAS